MEEEPVAFTVFGIQHQTVAELFSSMGGLWFYQNRKDVVFFLMENSGAFYFVENFKILAAFLQMGVLSEFCHTGSCDR